MLKSDDEGPRARLEKMTESNTDRCWAKLAGRQQMFVLELKCAFTSVDVV